MKHHYRINVETGIILEAYSGWIDLKFVVSCIKKVKSDDQFKEEYSIIVDLTHCWIDSEPEEVKSFVKLYDREINSEGVTALVADTPKTVAMAMLFKNLTNRPCEIFNQLENALDWAVSHRIHK